MSEPEAKPTFDKFDEYKFFAESTQHLSERRQAATGTYLTVNTAIFAILAILFKDAGLVGWPLVFAILPLFLVGIFACLIWHAVVVQYKSLIGWRYGQLMEMERQIPSMHQMYIKEGERYFEPGEPRRRFGFSRLERWLPLMFLGLYGLYAILAVIAAVAEWAPPGKGS